MKKIFNSLFFIIITYLLYNLFRYNAKINKTIVYVIAVIYIIAIAFLYKKIDKLKVNKYMFMVMFIIMLLLQIMAGYVFKVFPSWDFGVIYREALKSNELINDVKYFSIYPNNIPTLMILKLIFSVVNLLKGKFFIESAIGLNIIAIDVSIIFSVLIINKVYGKNKAFFSLIFILFTPLIYLSVPIFYTDTLSMPFPIIAIYLYILFRNSEGKRKKIIFSFSIAFITLLGMNIKPTVVIVYIAIIIYDIFINKYEKKREIIYPILSIVLIFALINIEKFIFKVVFSDYIEQIENNSFTITQHLVMGLHNDGKFNQKDYEYTLSFIGRAEKTRGDIEKIKEYFGKILPLENAIKFFTHKEVLLWIDGNYELNIFLAHGYYRTGTIQSLIYKNNTIYLYISQVQRIALIILMIIACFNKNKAKNEEIINYISRIAILGIIIFFAFWEINSRYLINYFPVFILIQIVGINEVNKLTENLKEKCIKTKNNILN